MPHTGYFLIGDLIANCLAGVAVALCCYWIIDTSWPMFVAMIFAMIAGMVIAMLLALAVFMRYFGAMEVMLPGMISGMWAGMIVGMRCSMGHLTLIDASLSSTRVREHLGQIDVVPGRDRLKLNGFAHQANRRFEVTSLGPVERHAIKSTGLIVRVAGVRSPGRRPPRR